LNTLRIIGGELKGKRLCSARGGLIRPTGNRQREAIFDILAHRVSETSVLDLFAGTGSLGIEALSRGARYCLFIDNHKTAVSILEKNIRSCRLEEKSEIIRWNLLNRGGYVKTTSLRFDLIFMDPPYNKDYISTALYCLHQSDCLKSGATIVVEHSPAESIPQKKAAYTLIDQRRYGKTLVSFLSYMV
jgi:16S rRNA (guanine966-N2)-methyltransferase